MTLKYISLLAQANTGHALDLNRLANPRPYSKPAESKSSNSDDAEGQAAFKSMHQKITAMTDDDLHELIFLRP